MHVAARPPLRVTEPVCMQVHNQRDWQRNKHVCGRPLHPLVCVAAQHVTQKGMEEPCRSQR